MNAPRSLLVLLCCSLACCALSCGPVKIDRNQYLTAKSVPTDAEYLKAYTRLGDLYILQHWRVDSNRVMGTGVRLDINRDKLERREFDIPASEITLFETNTNAHSMAASGVAITLVAHALLTIYCITNPKACFGSCPTFYASDGTGEKLMAEGFSSSVLPNLEAEDIDALPRAVPDGRTLTIRMKNEALETHVVRAVDVLAVRHLPGERIFKTDSGSFFEASQIIEPISAQAASANILDSLRAFDGKEYHCKTDSNDLGKKETIDLTFDPHEQGAYGIVIGCRQAFVSTYLFYTGLSYLGSEAGEELSHLANGDVAANRTFEAFQSALGGVEVWAQEAGGNWRKEGEICEMGPIASDIHLVPLRGIAKPKHIRLVMSQGAWRIDYVAMAKLTGQVQPILIHPSSREHTHEQVLFRDTLTPVLRPPSLRDALITLPGDEYTYKFELPEDSKNYDLFLRSKGYYIEWMREDWLRDEDPIKAAAFFYNPRATLRSEAPRFKAMEDELELEFWRTKISRMME